MKTKLALIGLTLLFSLSSFAGSLVKTDSGYVSWTVNVNKKKDGTMTYVRLGVSIDASETSSPEEMSVAMSLTFNSPVGGRKDFPMKYEVTDERSQESVVAKIKETIASSLAGSRVEAEEAELELKNLECSETGFLKKKLNCKASFTHVQKISVKLLK